MSGGCVGAFNVKNILKIIYRALFPPLLLVLGLCTLKQSYEEYGRWQYTLNCINDPSGAELYEVNFWINAPLAVLLIVIGGIVMGRLWRSY